MATTTKPNKKSQRTYVRFTLTQRVEHIVMLLSFGTLGLTGLPQKFSSHPLAIAFIRALGGIENVRFIHHTAAIVMMFGVMYHILAAGYKIFVERRRLTMLPVLQDGLDALYAFLYNIGLRKNRPQMGRYTFEEKAEYWAFVWGAIVMGFTGFLMWNPITASRFLPGEFIPAAKAAHGGEAVLAVLAIIVWHMYGVHLKHFNTAMWTGRLTEDEMLHEHPLELADIKAGVAERPADPKTLRRRQMIYYPVAGVLAVIMLAGIYGFIGAENTALTTVPPQPEKIQVFVPQTPTPLPTFPPTVTPLPTSTAAPAGSTTPVSLNWMDNIAPILAAQKCTTCHDTSATGGLNLLTYQDASKGGIDGPIFVPGNAAGSLLIQKFTSGGHPYATLSPDELALIEAWINAGAPEK